MIRAPARSGDSLVLVLGRRATAEGSRGFQPTVGHPAKPFRRGATIESTPRDRRPISFAPMPPAFNRRSATNHACVIVLRGLKPTATVKCRSATGGGSAPQLASRDGPFVLLPFVSAGRGCHGHGVFDVAVRMKQRRGLLTEPSQPPARSSRRRCDPGLRLRSPKSTVLSKTP